MYVQCKYIAPPMSKNIKNLLVNKSQVFVRH